MLVNIFGSSPVQPLEKHIDLGHRAAAELTGFFEAVIAQDWDAAGQIRDTIERLEREAESLKKEIRVHLPKSLFMPVPREDLLELLAVQDRIPDLALAVANVVLIRRMQIPEHLVRHFTDFVARAISATAQALKSVRELDELFASGFRGAEAKLVEDMIEDIERIDAETAIRQQQLMTDLVEIESSLDPVHAVFLYRVIDQVTDIAYMAGRVGHRLDVLLAR
ncbi:MAG: TIGR00153 family protein [Woeseiaceae bacterium]|jgi:predicted phosphate transport protein (TIGR00153 family)|nr:TIGR00153 family protein [Woeseiaceae bacterium]